jgi:WD40 repeat protein
MRRKLVLALSLLLTACGNSGPVPVTTGPRVEAALVAVWPAAAPARQTAFSPDGTRLATSDASGAITIRSTRDWKAIAELKHPRGATALHFTNDGKQLFSAGYDGIVRKWDLARHKVVQILKGSGATLWTIDLSPDGKQLATGGEDAIIRIWNLDQPARPAELRGHTRNIWEVRFSPDGKRLASCSFDYSVRLWDAVRDRALKTLAGHKQSCVGLDYSPDGRILASGGDDSTIRLWRASDGTPLRTIENGRHVDKVAFSPDGRWLASGGHPHGEIGELWHQLTGGGGEGDAVRIWRLSDGALVAGLPHPDDTYLVTFSRDGRWLVTSGEDNRFRLWRIEPAKT